MKIIKVDFDNLEKVIHLSDIHIRLYKRHKEYRGCFKQLYKELEKMDLKKSVIVVAGDILHSKLDLSPESVELASEFLKNLAELSPTLVLDGNHDLNLSNPHRLKSLHPIINNIGHNNLHYLSNSGVYQVADVQFALMGISDEQVKWPTSDDLTSNIKIALYHGPVYGAKTDTNFTISSRHVELSNFNGFDVVMLGDIHKFQVLQEYDKINKKPCVVYCSSLIQQNQGENITGHGYVEWFLPSCDYKFHELKNDFGYYTLFVENGKFDIPLGIPNNLRLRLMHDGLETSQINKILSIIKKDYNVVDVSINRVRTELLTDGLDSTVLNIGDLTNTNVQNNLIKEWLDINYPSLDNSLIEAIVNLNRKINGEVQYTDQSRNINWKPLKMSFSNLFSFGDNNYIDFSQMTGTNGIFAPNTHGKSASMEALIFTLFDKTPRAYRGDHIMNNKKKKFESELLFMVNESVYGIKRVGKRKKNGSVKVDVEFWKQDNSGSIENLNGEDRFSTNANIRSIVGTYEDFILTTLSSQNASSLFIDTPRSERKNLLNRFMGLNIFEILEYQANDNSKELQAILKKFSREDFSDKLSELQNNIGNTKTEISEIQTNLDKLKLENSKLQIDIESLISKKSNIPVFEDNSDDLKVEIKKLTTRKTAILENVSVLETNLKSEIESLTSLEKLVVNEDVDMLKFQHEEFISKSLSFMQTQDKILWKNSIIFEKTTLKERLSNFKYNDDCEFCVLNNKSKIEQIYDIDVELIELRSELDSLISENILLESDIDYLNMFSEKYLTVLGLKKSISSSTSDISNIKDSIEKYENQIDKINDQISKNDSEIKLVETYRDQIIKNDNIDFQMSEKRKLLSEIQEKIDKVSHEKMELHASLKVFETARTDIMEKLQEMSDIEKEFEAHKYYLEAVSKDGISYEIISKIIPNIEDEINIILSQIVNFNIALDVDGKTFGGRIVYDTNDSWPLENSSGMERFISSLAIRVALLRASNLPKPNFLIIDEGMGSLDSEYLPGMQLLFDILKLQFEFVIIISHLDNIRDMVDNIIEIRKENGYSYMNTNK